MFTNHLFKVSREITLFNASVTTTANHFEDVPVYIEIVGIIITSSLYTELTNYRYNGINPLVHGTSI